MSTLRIAVALPHLGVYGGIRRFLELGSVWASRGHQIALFTPRTGAGQRPWLPFPGQVEDLAALSSGRWDAVLSPDPDLFLSAAAPGALKVFYAVLEGAPRAKEAWRRADIVLANSVGIRRHLARRGVRAIDAAGGVNTAQFRPPEPDPRVGRLERGEPLRALVYGRMSRARKGSWIAARAIESASRWARVPVELTLFDAPPERAETPSLPRPLSIPTRWVIGPSQDDLRDLYAGSDLFVSAERRAGWCNTAAEAMACGAAVVCTRSGTEDFAIDGKTASVVPLPWNAFLSRRIARLLRDPDRLRRMAERGRSKISEFTWERTADRIERAIVERLEGRTNG